MPVGNDGEGTYAARSKYEEADLYLRLFELYSSDSLASAIKWFYSGFDAEDVARFNVVCPSGSAERGYFWKIGNFFDLLGTFMKRGYLDKDLLIDFCPDDVRSYWTRVSSLVKEMRVRYDDPGLYSDLELLCSEIEKRKKDIRTP